VTVKEDPRPRLPHWQAVCVTKAPWLVPCFDT